MSRSQGIRKVSCNIQDGCFTPRKQLQKLKNSFTYGGKENSCVSDRLTTCSSPNSLLKIGDLDEITCQVEEACFTPRHSLKHSPPLTRHHDVLPYKNNKNNKNDDTEKKSKARNRTEVCVETTPPNREVYVSNGDISVERKVQDVCFTPKKCLRRSPPQPGELKYIIQHTPTTPVHEKKKTAPISSSGHKYHLVNKETDTTTSQRIPTVHFRTQRTDMPSTLHWELSRTPTTTLQDLNNLPQRRIDIPPTSFQPYTDTIPSRSLKSLPQKERDIPPTSHWELLHTPTAPYNSFPKKEVDAPSTTPVRPTSEQHLNASRKRDRPTSQQHLNAHVDKVDDAMLTSHWELPRTPVMIEQVDPAIKSHKLGSSSLSHLSRSDVIPTHSIAESPHQKLDEATKASPPIKASNDVNTLPEMKCTEEDLAFLQHRDLLNRVKELQVESEQLMKEGRTMNREKELLEHTSIKVQKDIESLRNKYQETLSTIKSLISGSSPLLVNKDEEHHLKLISDQHCQKRVRFQEPSLTDIITLKKVKQLTSAQVDKAEKNLKEKMARLDQTKHQLREKIREHEEKDEQTIKLQSRIQDSVNEQLSLKRKLQTVKDENDSTKAKIELLLSDLAPEKFPDITDTSDKDRKYAEERLKRIIRQCELYLERHQILKEMGTRTKNKKQ